MIGSLQTTLTKDQCEIIRAALYFDIFKYPLNKQELFENSAINIEKSQFLVELDQLLSAGLLRQEGDFVLCHERSGEDLQKRLRGNAGANKIMPVAMKYSKLISAFPFVEGICLSGALSKNYFDEKGDIDFFIITKPGRLWICRTLLILVYKLLPKQIKKYWCVNYFISSDNLTIPDVNVFTGTELAYLIPTVNYSLYKQLLEKNNWYKNRFPNKDFATEGKCLYPSKNLVKKIVEWVFSGIFGTWTDNTLLKYTLRHWRRKFPDMKDEDFDLQFRSRKDVCKRHTFGFQNKVLVNWEEKTIQFEKKFSVKVNS